MFTVENVVRGTQGALVGGDLAIPVSGVSIDTRTLAVGAAFFAIHGQNDGHRFLRDAVARGAACLVVDTLSDDLPVTVPVVLVDETTRALGRFAAYHRARFTVPVASVTNVSDVPLFTSRIVTLAPGTTPFASLTVPMMVPVVTCAGLGEAVTMVRTHVRAARKSLYFVIARYPFLHALTCRAEAAECPRREGGLRGD